MGLEQESWFWPDTQGKATRTSTPNWGAGPNILFRFGMARFDVAFHYRDKPDQGQDSMVDGELMVRFHAYF